MRGTRQIKRPLEGIDLCIRMFKEGFDPETIEPKLTFRKSPALLPKGVGSRMALEILRETGEAFTVLARTGIRRTGNRHAGEDDPRQLQPPEEPGY
jgi:hypothetical protein